MKLLGASFFNSSWFLIIVLVVVIGALLMLNYSRSKKESQYREDLNAKIVKGAKVKTATGIYGTVLSVRSTTDGKIVLIETGEGKNVSYMEIHINAIYGVDDKEDLVLDKDGNEVTMAELKELEKAEKEAKEAETKPAEEPAKETEEASAVEEKPAKAKSTRTKKTKSE